VKYSAISDSGKSVYGIALFVDDVAVAVLAAERRRAVEINGQPPQLERLGRHTVVAPPRKRDLVDNSPRLVGDILGPVAAVAATLAVAEIGECKVQAESAGTWCGRSE